MNPILNKVLIFGAGAAVGAGASWFILKTRYERIAQEEIDSVKEVFARRELIEADIDPEEEDIDPEIVEAVKEEAENILKNEGYTNYAVIKKNDDVEKPYVIPPEEAGEFSDYEYIYLTHYADKVLTDNFDEPVEDVEGTVGLDSLERFGEYESDTVFVRNDRLKADYEIQLDVRKFSELDEE